MRARRAEQFNGYNELKLVDLPKPAVTDWKVLVRITAAGVTPLDHNDRRGKWNRFIVDRSKDGGSNKTHNTKQRKNANI